MDNPKRIIGFVAGAFDLIHPGYVSMFKLAKDHCDHLVVGLHNAPTHKSLQPIHTLFERIMILHSINFVDQIIPYESEDELILVLEQLRPHIRILGSDYFFKNGDKWSIIQSNVTRAPDGPQPEYIRHPRTNDRWSTTSLKERVNTSFLI